MPDLISVLVAVRTAMASQLLCRALREQRRYFTVVGWVDSPKALLKQVAEQRPDVAVISANLDGDPQGGIKLIRELRLSAPTTCSILLLECSAPEQVIDAFSAGAKGVACQTNSFEVLCKCIRCVYAGQIWAGSRELQWVIKALGEREPARIVDAKGIALLTEREAQVVSMLVEGLPNHKIAVKLGVSEHTVKNHLFHIYEKLGISNRVELSLCVTGNRERSWT